MQNPPLDPDVNDAAPTDSILTPYDQEHAVTYMRLLDADAEDADWREVAKVVLHIDSEHEPERARRAYETHLARAKWVDKLEAVADRGYFDGEEILACKEAGVAVTLPKPMTSNAKAEGRFGKQDFAYLPDEDVYRCPSGQLLPYHYTNIEHGMTLRRYWSTAACRGCAIKSQCTPSKERRITRWEHEHVVEEVQRRLDSDPDAMRTRRETVEHPFGTIKARMGATHFLMKRLRNVAAEMALHVLAYNLTRVMNIVGKPSLIAAIRAA